LSGFWAKFFVVKAALEIKEYLFVVVALVVGLLTLYSMMKIWNEAFWKKDPDLVEDKNSTIQGLFSKQNLFMTIPVILLALITLTIGFNPEPFFQIAERTAHELMNPSIYINTVLGNTP